MLKTSIEADFETFNKDNPKVYDLFVTFARTLKARGYKHGSAALIFERIRWQIAVETTGSDFKLNNNHRAYMARLVMAREPDLAGFFSIRELRSCE